MIENIYKLSVTLAYDKGVIPLLVEVVPFLDPNLFLVKNVYFQKKPSDGPFMTEFHIERKQLNGAYQWFHKERDRQTMLTDVIGEAIAEKISQTKSTNGQN